MYISWKAVTKPLRKVLGILGNLEVFSPFHFFFFNMVGWGRVVLFDTPTSNTLFQSTMAVVAIYIATAKKLEFAIGKSRMATLF